MQIGRNKSAGDPKRFSNSLLVHTFEIFLIFENESFFNQRTPNSDTCVSCRELFSKEGSGFELDSEETHLNSNDIPLIEGSGLYDGRELFSKEGSGFELDSEEIHLNSNDTPLIEGSGLYDGAVHLTGGGGYLTPNMPSSYALDGH
ncbi:unnamed protein product [Pieris brassicae]|uniref:Uncharacterized protein n=1 Tax=Pieris brassicae TaxID=7116 RepID=A0A9P0T5W4_PIEBR|nr:unnamed protein product [Pieris brassicae]